MREDISIQEFVEVFDVRCTEIPSFKEPPSTVVGQQINKHASK